MNKKIIFVVLSIVCAASSCGNKNCCNSQTDDEQSPVECTILPIDCFTGEIGFTEMNGREFTFTADIKTSPSAKSIKVKFDAINPIPEKEEYVSRTLADYDKQVKITCLAAYADSGFRLTCDKPVLGHEPGTDLSRMFMVYPLAEFSFPDFSIISKRYNPVKGITLYDYLSGGAVWMQREYSRFITGLFFAPVSVPADIEKALYTFTLYIPFIGQTSDGKKIHKTFEGSFSFNPALPG